MGGILHTEEETDSYIEDITSVFKMMKQTGAGSLNLWEQLKDMHLDYAAKGLDRKEYRDAVQSQSEHAFSHMEAYWAELLKDGQSVS